MDQQIKIMINLIVIVYLNKKKELRKNLFKFNEFIIRNINEEIYI